MKLQDEIKAQPKQQKLSLAITTVPIQPWEEPFKPEEALKKGTIFPGLYLPFHIGGEIHG